MGEAETVDKVSLMDARPVCGVDAIPAHRRVAYVMHTKPSLMHAFGTGSIVELADPSHRSLNVLGSMALGLRNLKPSGVPLGLRQKPGRLEALELPRSRTPACVKGSAPGTASSTTMATNDVKMARLRCPVHIG